MFYRNGLKEFHEEHKGKNFVLFVKTLRALRVEFFTTKKLRGEMFYRNGLKEFHEEHKGKNFVLFVVNILPQKKTISNKQLYIIKIGEKPYSVLLKYH
jgi:hypothetical protein